MSTQKELDALSARPVLELIERALAEVRRMCQPGTHWNMQVPVDVEDSDVVISGALIAAKKELLARGVVPSAPSPDALTVARFIVGWWPGLEDDIDWGDQESRDAHPAYLAARRIVGGVDSGGVAPADRDEAIRATLERWGRPVYRWFPLVGVDKSDPEKP